MGKKRGLIISGSLLFIVFLAACSLFSATPTPPSPGSTAVPPTSAPASGSSSSASGACANDYYPVPKGASWSYSSTGSTSVGDYSYTRTVTQAGATGFTTDDAFSTGVNASFDWKCEGGNLAALDAGSTSFTMTTSKVKMTSDSVTADGYNIPSSFASGNTWAEKVTVDGTIVQNSSAKKVKSQIVAQLNCTAAGTDSVTVPAGTFDTVKATCQKSVVVSSVIAGKTTQLAANKETITFWYAKGVGYVKSTATGGTDNETILLTSYKIK